MSDKDEESNVHVQNKYIFYKRKNIIGRITFNKTYCVLGGNL